MYVEQVEELSGGGGYTIHLSYRVVVEEVILLLRFYCHPQSQLGMGIRGLGLGLDKNCFQLHIVKNFATCFFNQRFKLLVKIWGKVSIFWKYGSFFYMICIISTIENNYVYSK